MKKSPVVNYIIVSSAIFLVVITFLMRDNLIRWIGAEMTLLRQRKQIEYYQKSNAQLDEQLHNLSTDRDTLEKFARENFHFAAPDEDVYVIEGE
ncbi:MAG: septum formation initiator family protein [Bacteroidales bacterium]|nr:septum formation initiator family protein [Bacteroidales bacterium]